MEINFNDLVVSRMIMHTIKEKQENQDHATVEYETELLEINDEVIGVIKTRLIDAAGKQSKAFSLEFDEGYVGQGSFYQTCDNILQVSDDEFITKSRHIAELLAESQTRTNIPGGFMILLDCMNFSLPVYIVIKAEPHQALQKVPGQTQLALLRSVFLSPSQKLYKIGIIAEKEEPSGDAANERYNCFLFDDQFRIESTPAEYFYKDFLGFSIGNNAKIQSQRFYDKTENFIKENIGEPDIKTALLQTLRNEFIVNQNAIVTPAEFAREYLATPSLRDDYIGNVAHELPSSIVKDSTLIKTKLNRRKIDFPHNINLVGPNDAFDDNVQFIRNASDLEGLTAEGGAFTLVKINGLPHTK